MTEHPKQIGAYKVLDVLGEGGMGIVYAAEQSQPLRRRVALKVIKWGMDTKEVLARFEVERQALALLDHPNIAKVFEAGATTEGRPFFAMELVRGVGITRYCDLQQSTIAVRLGLVLQACSALQHAHDRGILHRDVKPTNMLVTEVDGQAVLKVIDFGMAKAVNQRLTERTLFTEEGRLIGTPEYMSPEQADVTALDVDHRTDVFSLGVVLYELLAGVLPFDAKSMRSAGYLEIQRIIKEEEPPTPSQRLSRLANDVQEIARLRSCRLQELSGSLRRGLDAVVMKALAKRRQDRYASCAELAQDLQRFLDGKPVQARTMGIAGRLLHGAKRFHRRHPTVVPAVSCPTRGCSRSERAGSCSCDRRTTLRASRTSRRALRSRCWCSTRGAKRGSRGCACRRRSGSLGSATRGSRRWTSSARRGSWRRAAWWSG